MNQRYIVKNIPNNLYRSSKKNCPNQFYSENKENFGTTFLWTFELSTTFY